MSKRSPRATKRTTPEADRYASLARILRLVRVLEVTQGLSTAELLESQSLTRRSWERYRTAIEAAGLPLVCETRGREKVWRIQPGAHRSALRIHQAHAVALLVQQRGTTFLRGTGFHELLEEVYHQAEAMLNVRDRARVRHLDRKILDRNDDAIVVADSRADDVNELVSALLYEERLVVRYKGRPAPFDLDPYTLVIYRKGLYLVAWSHLHGEIRRFALDRFDAIDRKRGERFEYPNDYDPARLFAGTFGLVGDRPPVRVRVRFWGARAIDDVNRRRVHPSQAWEAATEPDGSRVLRLDVADDDLDLERWILGFGEGAEVLAPSELRARIFRRASEIVRREGAPTSTTSTH
jgi:proteasome accessory factor B